MCISPKIDAKTHVPGCSMREAKVKKKYKCAKRRFTATDLR